MTAAAHADKTQDFGRDELDIRMDKFIRKVGDAIDDARSKMSDKDREEADRKSDAILKNASDAASARRRSA